MSRDEFKVMDSDMHVIEPSDMFEKYLDQRFLPWAPQISRAPGKRGGVFLFQGERLPSCDVDNPFRMYGMSAKTDDATSKMRLQGYNGPSQLEAMDLEGIDIAVMYPTVCLYIPNGLNNVDGQLSAAVCRAYNNWLYDLCQTDPQRMKVAAMVPQHDPKEAVKEAKRAVKELGAVGIYMRPNFVNGVNFHSADYAELWATLEELNVPVGFHEGTGSIYPQDGSEFGDNRLMLHACSHPIGANAGWAPFWLGRMDRDYELYKDWDAHFLTKLPSEYFKSNCYVGTEADEAELGYTVDAIGNENIVFSSDYPHHDSEFPESVNEFLSHEDINKETKQKILWDNCTKLYAI